MAKVAIVTLKFTANKVGPDLYFTLNIGYMKDNSYGFWEERGNIFVSINMIA